MSQYPFRGKIAGFEHLRGGRVAVVLARKPDSLGVSRPYRVIWISENSRIRRRDRKTEFVSIDAVEVGDELSGQVFRKYDGREALVSATVTFENPHRTVEPSPEPPPGATMQEAGWQCAECGYPDLTESAGVGYCPTCMRDVTLVPLHRPPGEAVEATKPPSGLPELAPAIEPSRGRGSGSKFKVGEMALGCANLLLIAIVLTLILKGLAWVGRAWLDGSK